MHQCFRVPELTRIISENLYGDGADPQRRRNVGALAATCSQLYNVAYPVLWSRLYSFRPILRCFPGEILAQVPDALHKRRLVLGFAKEPQPSQWDRCLHYAKCVRYLHTTLENVSGEAVFRMAMLHRQLVKRPFFPRLREIQWYEKNELYFSLIIGFLAPTLKTVEIYQPPFGTALEEFVSYIGSHPYFPFLQKFSVFYRVGTNEPAPESRDIAASTSEALWSIYNLRDLICDYCLSNECIAMLATNKALTSVSSHLSIDDQLPALLKAIDEPIFPAVEELSFTVKSLANPFVSLVDSMESQNIRIFEIVSRQNPSAESLSRILKSFKPHRGQYAMTNLALVFPEAQTEVPPTQDEWYPSITLRLLDPILRFTNLETLTIVSCDFDPDDAEIVKLAKSFPRLRSLQLRPLLPPQITLNGMVQLTNECQHLRSLGVHFDARDVPSTTTSSAIRASRLHVDPTCTIPLALDVMCCPIDSGIDVALFLSIFWTRFKVELKPLTATRNMILQLQPTDKRAKYSKRWQAFVEHHDIITTARREEMAYYQLESRSQR